MILETCTIGKKLIFETNATTQFQRFTRQIQRKYQKITDMFFTIGTLTDNSSQTKTEAGILSAKKQGGKKEGGERLKDLLKGKGNLVKVGISVPGVQQHLLAMHSVLKSYLQPTVVTGILLALHIPDKSMETQLCKRK